MLGTVAEVVLTSGAGDVAEGLSATDRLPEEADDVAEAVVDPRDDPDVLERVPLSVLFNEPLPLFFTSSETYQSRGFVIAWSFAPSQYDLPTSIFPLLSTSLGQDSNVQSRIPLATS